MGIVVALTAALFWAISARFYGHSAAQWSVFLLNFAKNLSAVVLLALALWLLPMRLTADWQTVLILVLSGVIGIGIGDTALFAALRRMGEQNTLLIAETLAPLLVVMLGFVLLAEELHWLHGVGIFLVLLATDLAIGWRRSKSINKAAVGFAVVAAACQATGALVSRYYLSTTELGVLESAVWRLLGGLLFVSAVLLVMMMRRQTIRYQPLTLRQSSKLFVAILLGTVLGVFMLQWSLDLLRAGVAQTLLASSPLFAVIVAWFNRDAVTAKQWLAVVIGVVGVAAISLA
ncbi:DMT family transporter [Reinekea sp. G2M2-21]|uniref:DMT family transporter n=1 Tax=Reinekea sp. G2M2-21 TaxID=2788942 RepID=UPI0018A9CAF0|nr:DMT family transporter [Reinekea sp. G2M2-21]